MWLSGRRSPRMHSFHSGVPAAIKLQGRGQEPLRSWMAAQHVRVVGLRRPQKPECAATLNQRKDKTNLTPFVDDWNAQFEVAAEGSPPSPRPGEALKNFRVRI